VARRKRRYKSRLNRVEKRRNLRLTVVFLLMTGGLIVLMAFVGLPLLIRAAVWWGDWQESQTEVRKDDQIPPAAPRLAYLPVATNSAKLVVKGYTEEGARVKVMLNEEEVKEVVASNEGIFLASDLRLARDENQIWVMAVDQSGNESQQSKVVSVIFDDEVPDLEIEKPVEGKEYYGEGERNVEVQGITEEGVQLTINDRWVIVGKGGRFNQLIHLEEGENMLKIKTEDEAGNVTEKELKVVYHP
jgi:hypothetical protein